MGSSEVQFLSGWGVVHEAETHFEWPKRQPQVIPTPKSTIKKFINIIQSEGRQRCFPSASVKGVLDRRIYWYICVKIYVGLLMSYNQILETQNKGNV